MENFSQVADFCIVYIEEAHPLESGHFEGNFRITSHKRMEDRLDAANTLKEAFQKIPMDDEVRASCSIFVDKMENEAERKFAAFPERLYILREDEVAYVGGVGPYDYNLDEVEDWLRNKV